MSSKLKGSTRVLMKNLRKNTERYMKASNSGKPFLGVKSRSDIAKRYRKVGLKTVRRRMLGC